MDAEALGSLELGLVEVTHPTFGHQPGGLVRESVTTLAGACEGVLVGVLTGVRHGASLQSITLRLYPNSLSWRCMGNQFADQARKSRPAAGSWLREGRRFRKCRTLLRSARPHPVGRNRRRAPS